MPKYWVKNYFAHGRFPEVGQKQKTEKENTPGTVGGPGGRDRTLTVKSRKIAKKSFDSPKCVKNKRLKRREKKADKLG